MTTDPSTNLLAYGVRVSKKQADKGAIVIAFLLLLFFEVVGRNQGLYGVEAINTAMEMLEQHTIRMPDVTIGG